MRKPGRDGTFLICLGLNAILNLHWTLPAWVLLALHFAIGLSIWWFVGALAIWFVAILLMSLLLKLVDRLPSGNAPNVEPDPDRRAEIFEKSRALRDRDV